MSIRSKGISAAVAFTMTGVMYGIGTQAANAASVEGGRGVAVTRAATAAAGAGQAGQTRAGADEICAVLGIGSGAAGLSKALAKGASWVGIGASVGCYLYSKAKEATPAQKRAAMIKSYKNFQAKSDIKKLEALGYSCRKKDSGGGGGTDSVPFGMRVGYRDIVMKGVTYKCGNTSD